LISHHRRLRTPQRRYPTRWCISVAISRTARWQKRRRAIPAGVL
jgi:hypothetical protein